MGFNNNTPRQEFVASAAQVDFAFNFKIYADTDIKAYLTPVGQIAEDTADFLTLTTDYTIVIDGDAGGTLTLTSGATNGDKVTITRELPYTRTIDYAYGGDLKESTLDLDQDYQTYLAQQLESSKVRFLNIPNSVQGVDATLPAPVSDAYFKWSADALSIENDTTIPDAVTTSAANATQAQLYEWEAEAERLTADSYATEAEDVFVNLVTSDGDGTFTYTPTTDYSSLHWAAKAATFNPADFVIIENNETTIHNITVDADYTLTVLQNKYGRIEITDTGVLLTTGRNIIVDNVQRRFIFVNSTAQILTVKTAAGTGIAVAAGETVDLYNDGTNVIEAITIAISSVLQTQNYTTGTFASGTVAMPVDDTIPQITEGNQFMSFAFTPLEATSKLRIDVTINLGLGTIAAVQGALFRDATANALGAASVYFSTAGSTNQINFTVWADAVSTALTTFTVRAGCSAAVATYFNGLASGRILGGSAASSITITEIKQ